MARKGVGHSFGKESESSGSEAKARYDQGLTDCNGFAPGSLSRVRSSDAAILARVNLTGASLRYIRQATAYESVAPPLNQSTTIALTSIASVTNLSTSPNGKPEPPLRNSFQT
jgi:hypothetical protein